MRGGSGRVRSGAQMVNRHIDRLLAELDPHSGGESGEKKSLADFEHARVVIVLGDPGLGKTEELRHAAESANTRVIPVQEAIHRTSLGPVGQRVFLDALDESRSAGGTIDALVAKLLDTGTPSLVLSCRVADWYGPSDLRRLRDIYGNANVVVLRLLGLSREQAKEFLGDLVPDPEAFIVEAENRGLDEWLQNPNDLLLLAKIVKAGWPSTRMELFERSSIQMARERNIDRARVEPALSDDVLLDAAGAVCTSLLVSGSQGVYLDAVSESDPNFGRPTDFAVEPNLVQTIAKSSLFAGETPRYVKPRHRTTAEFLSARWLTRRVASGQMSLRRVLAIISPGGRPPTELRGIFAWLITRLPNVEAMQVIDADPFGLLIYGDADTFDATRLDALLSALVQLAQTEPFFRVGAWNDRPWLAFARPELLTRVSSILTSENPNPHLLDGLLSALANGDVVEGSVQGIAAVLYNPMVHQDAKVRAVRSYQHQSGSCEGLAVVFRDCASGRISDPKGKLRIELFRRCHNSIAPSEFAELLAELWDDRHLSIGLLHYRFVLEIPPATLAQVLDWLSEEQRRRPQNHSPGGLSPFHCGYEIRHFLEKALLIIEREGLATLERITRWRTLFSNRISGGQDEEWQELWTRLNDNARLFIHVFETEVLEGDPAELWSRFIHRLSLHDGVIRLSADAVRYLITLAAAQSDDDVARAIAQCAANSIWGSPQDVELFQLAGDLWQQKECLTPFLAGLRYWEIPDWRIEQARGALATRLRSQRERERTLKWIREGLEAVRSWSNYQLLEFVGRLYFFGWSYLGHGSADASLTKREAFQALLGDELTGELEVALVAGIVNADLPSPTQQGEWRSDNRHYRADYAVLAALELSLEQSQAITLSLENTSAAVALVVHHWGNSTLAERAQDGAAEGWFWNVFRTQPEMVSAAVVALLRPLASRGERLLEIGPPLSAARVVAPEAAILLATAAVSELRPSSYEDVEDAIHVLLDAGRTGLVSAEAHTRLSEPVSSSERAFWLGLGWLARPDDFSDELAEFMSTGDIGDLWKAVRVIAPDRHGAPIRTLTVEESGWLAERVGSRFGRVDRPSGVTSGDTNPWDATEVVNRLVDGISVHATEAATAELARLADLAVLASYRVNILHALAMQRNRRRDKEFSAPSLASLKAAFENAGVTSADDVVAQTVDALAFLQEQYRGGDTTGWRKYWNTGARGVITSPRIEDHCRDVLLDDLRPRLQPCGLEVNQATPANAGNEADASIQTRGVTERRRVPIEMKMGHNREVWTAPRGQLASKYMIDPLAGGRGVYIVFWTGADGIPAPAEKFARPTTAKAMEQILVAGLSDEERAQLAIIVLDVSKR